MLAWKLIDTCTHGTIVYKEVIVDDKKTLKLTLSQYNVIYVYTGEVIVDDRSKTLKLTNLHDLSIKLYMYVRVFVWRGGGDKRTWTVIHTAWPWFQILPVYNNTRNVFIVIYVRCVRD